MQRVFPEQVPKPAKRRAGRTPAALTPLQIRALGTTVDEPTRAHVEKRLGRQFGKLAAGIERLTVRFSDINGLRGGVDQECQIEIVQSGQPTLVVEARAVNARAAFDRATASAKRAMYDASTRVPGRSAGAAPTRAARREQPASAPNPPPEDGGLIGRRVGRARVNLEAAAARPEKQRRDALVDTSQVGVSASDRKAGGGSTARRNTRLNTAGLTAALEDSAQERPSRKSTRRSLHHAKRDSNLRRRQMRRVRAPKRQAIRSAAKAT